MRVADFFCGAGGFSEGFRQAGFDIVFALDKWEYAITTYSANQGIKAVKSDIIEVSLLDDEKFNQMVPDTEIIIGSPPCQSFSQSNKSGNADKTLGIKLIEAYLRIIARKKFKKNSILKYWLLENVPKSQYFIKDKYSARDLGLSGDFILHTKCQASGEHNAKYYGAPTNRLRYICGDFIEPIRTNDDSNLITLGAVLNSFDNSVGKKIKDINYNFELKKEDLSDHYYTYELADFEINTARRLKLDKGYMGKMSFPENPNKPARTVMATMSTSSRESMILAYGKKFRLPTVREVATMMSFPIDYRFYGPSKTIKYKLVGNAVCPKMSYALAKAICNKENMKLPQKYKKIKHDETFEFYNLNGLKFLPKIERKKLDTAKFKYHIPYLIINRYRVELTNYHSDFKNKSFKWDTEIHYSQGKDKARVIKPNIKDFKISIDLKKEVYNFINFLPNIISHNNLQKTFCMTKSNRDKLGIIGPYEVLDEIKNFLDIISDEKVSEIEFIEHDIPKKILLGSYILLKILKKGR